MANISKTHNISQPRIISGKLTMLLLMLLTICVCCRPTIAETSIYVFDPNQSTVFRSGGIAGLQKTFSVTGQFRLTVDPDAGVASFETVDANLIEETDLVYGQSLNEIFNMTGLAGTIIDDTTIDFEGKTAEGTESDVRLKLSLGKGPAQLTGKTTPPPNSADMFIYDVNAVATKKYAGGTGEPNDPYQIATAADLIALGETPEDYDKHFILTADIDLDPNLPDRKVFDRAVIAPDTDPSNVYWSFQGNPFTGVFDGKGHRIFHLTIKGASFLGLFGELSEAEVRRVAVVDVNIVGSGDYVGGFAGSSGYLWGAVPGSIIDCCYSTGRVSGTGSGVGGLMGSHGHDGSLSDCHSTATVTGGDDVGGLVGENGGLMTGCYSTGGTKGERDVGGLAGVNGGTVIQCRSSGMVQGHESVGGLVGIHWAGSEDKISESFSSSPVTGGEGVGGLAGSNGGTITDCYSMGNVAGSTAVGGLVGRNSNHTSLEESYRGTVLNSYCTGAVSGGGRVGGLVGSDSWGGEVKASFWDIQTSGQAKGAGGTDKTTAEMQTAKTFLNADWDFVGETANGTEDIWSICEGTNYPRFVWQIPVGDFVCPDGVTIEDFSFFMEHWLDDNCDLSNDYCQGTDLDQSGTVDAYDLEIFFENWPGEK